MSFFYKIKNLNNKRMLINESNSYLFSNLLRFSPMAKNLNEKLKLIEI